MPYMSVPQKTTRKSIMKAFEDLLCSSKNMEILAESSLGTIRKGDEDLRIREMSAEEVTSLKGYADITSTVINLKGLVTVSYQTFYLFPCIFRFLKTFFFFGGSFYFIIKRCCTRLLNP